MENSKIEMLLSQILENQNSMKDEIKSIGTDVKEINRKMDNVYNQTADLTEFRTQTSSALDSISKDIRFVKRKVQDTEEDVFVIQDHLKIVK